jgi:glycosyltransferase involved in cell wall biosynthesis
MRVLWLTQMQLPAATGDSSMTLGGWHEGLRLALEQYEPDIELGVVSTGLAQHEPFRRGNATYYSLRAAPAPAGRIGRAADAWRGTVAIPLAAVDEAAAIARQFRPDVVHLHGTEHFLGLATMQLRAPCVATLQGVASVYERFMFDGLPFTGVLRTVASRQFIRGSSPLHAAVHMSVRAKAERQIISNLRFGIGQTDWDREVLKLLNPSATYFRCSRALQPAYYAAQWQGQASVAQTLFCTSSPSPYKGVETLLEALHLLVQGGYDNVRLRVAGAYPGSYMWPLVSQVVRKRGLEDFVTWLGPLGSQEIVEELTRATLYVLPSHIENESNSLIEAMLVGVPSVAAAVGGVPSVVRDGVDAVLYHDSDPFALAGAVAGLLDEPEAAQALGRAARERAHVSFDRAGVAHRTREIYELVAGGGLMEPS